MKYDMELASQLAEELVNLWTECSIKCERIENLVKQIKGPEK